MKKEKITLDNVKSDLARVLYNVRSIRTDMHLPQVLWTAALAVFLGILLNSVIVGVIISLFGLYPIYQYILAERENKEKKDALWSALERGDVSITTEVLSHIANETVYEPHSHYTPCHGAHRDLTKTITEFYFEGGGSWRLPDTLEHYDWSKEMHLSNSGLVNTSVEGNEFFVVTLQGYNDVKYIYPCKFFELDESLK